MPINTKTVLTAAAAAAAFVGLAAASATPWTGNFETGNFAQYAPFPYCAGPYSCQIVQHPVAEGRFAARFEVRPGDNYAHWNGERAQLVSLTTDGEGEESYWGWSIYLPSDYRDSRSFYQVFAEWHHSGLTGSPPVTFQVYRGRFVVRVVRSPDPDKATAWDQYDLGPIARGRWTRFIYHARWSADPATAVNEIWVNGMLRKRTRRHPNLFTGYSNYLAVGWYRAAEPITQVIYIDDVRVGSSFGELDAIGGTPPTRISRDEIRIEAFGPPAQTIAVTAHDRAGRLLARTSIRPTAEGRISLDLKLRHWSGRSPVDVKLSAVRGSARPALLVFSPHRR